ncbi:hypothetical protein AF72_03820 [Xylella taiwanensis]|uniref:Uncharacterized protein n=1 Tax=Xylella taiwanensis TaxID=1444770 RepID=Z9JL39_9GAMM|nr:hypothetical protein AF72_03820 [Xylella taiwanensis]
MAYLVFHGALQLHLNRVITLGSEVDSGLLSLGDVLLHLRQC